MTTIRYCFVVAIAVTGTSCGGGSRVADLGAPAPPAESARRFAADSVRALNDERELFAAAVAFGTPGTPVYDPARAHAYLQRFTTQFAASPRIREAQQLSPLLGEIARLQLLETDLRRTAARLDSLRARTAGQTQSVQQLQGELRKRDVQLKALQQELESLKAIDLRLRQRRPAMPPQ